MMILAHRGWHRSRAEHNRMPAFTRALDGGFGIETDIRDHNGVLVIAHDLPKQRSLPLAKLLAYYAEQKSSAMLALNIKSDGLAPLLMPLLKRHRIDHYFVFDMSGPEAVRYAAAGATLFTRQSDYEPTPACYSDAVGVWLDEFENQWITERIVAGHVNAKKRVCFVSPELHGHPYRARWAFYKMMEKKYPRASFLLCTDYPEKAAAFFYD